MAGIAGFGSVASAQSTKPTINADPQDQGVRMGQSALFSVKADSTTPLTYQWRWNGFDILDATNQSYTVPECPAAGESGAASCRILRCRRGEFGGSVTSKIAALVVLFAAVLSLTNQLMQTCRRFKAPLFNVKASGTPPLSFHWRHNGQFFSDNYAYSSNYFLPQLQWSDAGDYDVVVMNQYGSVTSRVAVLTDSGSDATLHHIRRAMSWRNVRDRKEPRSAFTVTAGDQYDQSPTLVCEPPSGSTVSHRIDAGEMHGLGLIGKYECQLFHGSGGAVRVTRAASRLLVRRIFTWNSARSPRQKLISR